MGKIRRSNAIPGSVVGAICWLLFFNLVRFASAQSVITEVNNGDPNNRVDIAILGDGYASSDMGKYANDVHQVIDDSQPTSKGPCTRPVAGCL